MTSILQSLTRIFVVCCFQFCLATKGQTEVFLDKELNFLLQTQNQGMILIWSKDMPLSILALEEAPAIASTLGLNLTTVTHEDMRSSELASHGILNHFPAIMLYRDGKLLPFIIQGYESPKSLFNILKEQL